MAFVLFAFVPLGCGGGGGGGSPMGPGTPDPEPDPEPDPVVATGTYSATFASTRVEGCAGLVPEGSTTGDLVVVQNGSAVTLRITDLSENILSNPTGTITAEGVFTFQGPVDVGNEDGMVTADGTITGTFTRDGRVNLTFSFSARSCTVEGTITGQS